MGDDAPMPHRVGQHEILLRIADGALTSVFLARGTAATNPDGYVAVELIGFPAAADRTFVSTFLASVTPLCRLRNAHVVRMFEAASDANGAFVVMDYVPGDSLARLHRRASESGATIPKAIALRILADALRGLHAAHELADDGGKPLGLVHGDFSPRNILVGTDGITRVTGFGFSRAPGTKGEPPAMPPPPPEGANDDRRADIWAAGVIAWEVLTGQKLGDHTALTTSPRMDPPRVSALLSDVPTTLDDVVAEALRIDPKARTATALALANALSDAAQVAGLLASPSEVAAHVARAAGPELVERRALFEDVRRAQRERPPSAPDVRTLIGIAGPLPPKRAPLPSLPDAPPPIDDGTSDLRIAIARQDQPADRADENILGQPIAATAAEDEPQIFRSPLAADVQPHDGARVESLDHPDDPVVAGLPSNGSPVRHVLATVKPWLTPPWTTRKISLFAGIGGGLVGFILVLVAVSGKAKDDTSPAGSSAHGLVAPGHSSLLEAPAAIAAKNASSGGPSLATHAHEDGSQLHIKANGPIASIRVDGRIVDAIVPAPVISVDLEETERDRPLRIVVTSTDGRSATATTDPAAATSDVDVTFGTKPTPRPRQRPAPASTVKHPWSKSKR